MLSLPQQDYKFLSFVLSISSGSVSFSMKVNDRLDWTVIALRISVFNGTGSVLFKDKVFEVVIMNSVLLPLYCRDEQAQLLVCAA